MQNGYFEEPQYGADNRRGLRLLLWLAVLVAVGIFVSISDERNDKIRGDLSTYSLQASKVLFAGGDPYDREQVSHTFKYLPTNAILLFPLSFFSVYTAQGIWLALNVGLLVWAFYSLKALLRPISIPWWVTFLTLAVTFRLLVMNLRLGQWNTSVFCLSFIGIRYIMQKKTAGSILLGLAIILKYMPAILLVYLIAQRKWKALSLTLASVIFWAILIPTLTVGPTRTVDLLQKFKAGSIERVDKMTKGSEVSSFSLTSTIYRALSPVEIETKDVRYHVNLFNLPRTQGSNIANAIAIILAIPFLIWLFTVSSNRELINTYGQLLLIGLCYLCWYLLAPGVRHAQLIGILPVTYCGFASLVIITNRRHRAQSILFLILLAVLYTSPSEIIEDTIYNQILEASGVIAYAMVINVIFGIWLFYKIGRTNLILKTIPPDNPGTEGQTPLPA